LNVSPIFCAYTLRPYLHTFYRTRSFSDIENRDEILSTIQVRLALRDSKICNRADSRDFNLPILLNNLESEDSHEDENCPPVLITGAGLSSPTPSTSKIFAPRTDDMDSGFLLPCDNSLMGNLGICLTRPASMNLFRTIILHL